MAGKELTAHIRSQRTPHARHLQAVGEPVVNKHAAGKGKYLRFILHAAKRSRKYEPVKIALKLSAPLGSGTMGVLFAQTLGGYELFPIHGH